MADGTPQAEFNIPYREVKGFTRLGVRVLRFPYQVPDRARCKHCNCIPKRIYHLLCPHHGLCFDCKKHCNGYYCDECCVNTAPEQLGAICSDFNLPGILQQVQCDVCHKVLLLGELEEHLFEHTNQGDVECSKVQETTNQHEDVSEKPLRFSDVVSVRCDICNEIVKNSDYVEHLKRHTQERNNQCDPIVQETPNQDTAMEFEETGSDETHPHTDYKEHSLDGVCNVTLEYKNAKHRSECPKIERKCSDCGVNVLNENLQNHQDMECQNRLVLCDACNGAVFYHTLGDHGQECLEKPLVCEDCKGEILRKDESKHASECPMRAVCCENCDGFYPYSSEKEHREHCGKKKLACEYCTLELKGNEEKDAHLKVCEEALIECAFKGFGCNKKAPRKEMQKHEKDPHNALLSQVILELEKRIESLERPLTALVKKLRNSDSVGTSQ
ncbi:zinc finger protein 235 isoform X1 [Ixodes scapularis]|uniref:zinc finger protein 235 isoform X1 n=2 Tax=Ixodes scapularis TaxID=6945 RepID=UPI001A9DC0CF|nr:zinc finger protein 235 isoform X1 [Ixodes scapularis]